MVLSEIHIVLHVHWSALIQPCDQKCTPAMQSCNFVTIESCYFRPNCIQLYSVQLLLQANKRLHTILYLSSTLKNNTHL